MDNPEYFDGIIGRMASVLGMVTSAISIFRRDNLEIEMTRKKMIFDMYHPPLPNYWNPQPVVYYQQPPCQVSPQYRPAQPQWCQQPRLDVHWVDTDSRCPYRYGAPPGYQNQSMYMPSNDVTFDNDDIIRQIGRRPPQSSPIFGRPY